MTTFTAAAGSATDPRWVPPFDDGDPILDETARIADGPVPRFGDERRWDCRAAGLAPNQRPNEAVLRFNGLTGHWLAAAKTVAMALLNPTHPAVRARGLYLANRRAKTKTTQTMLGHMKYLAAWAGATGRPDRVCEWGDEDCAAYLAHPATRAAPSRARGAEDLFRLLRSHGALLDGGGLSATVTPTVRRRQGELTTPVIPPSVFWPLVRACWTYIDVFAGDLISAREELGQLDAPATHGRTPPGPGTADARLGRWLSRADAYVPTHVHTAGRGPAGQINWTWLATLAGLKPAAFNEPAGLARRARVKQAVDNGVPSRPGTTRTSPTIVDHPGGGRGPWCPGFDRVSVSRELTNLRNAIYIFVGLMTMMRDSEIQGIPAGALGTRYGAPVIHSRVHKKHHPAGQPETWWVSEPVVQAIKVAEQITRDPARLFGSIREGRNRDMVGFDVREQIPKFIAWVNDHSPGNGLEPIPDCHLAPHMFRRTMAIITANEPDGEIALGITLKHNATRALANSITSGYAAATPAWALEFDHQGKNAAAGELVADWATRAGGGRIARGPGANTYLARLDHVTASTQPPLVHHGDERMLRDLLRDEFSTVRLGTLNHCLGDVEKAECLRNLSEEARAAGPVPSLCQPTTCRNAVITDKHMPIWVAEEEELVKRLKDRRIASVHRQRLQTQLDDVRKITRQEPK